MDSGHAPRLFVGESCCRFPPEQRCLSGCDFRLFWGGGGFESVLANGVPVCKASRNQKNILNPNLSDAPKSTAMLSANPQPKTLKPKTLNPVQTPKSTPMFQLTYCQAEMKKDACKIATAAGKSCLTDVLSAEQVIHPLIDAAVSHPLIDAIASIHGCNEWMLLHLLMDVIASINGCYCIFPWMLFVRKWTSA